MEYEQYTLADLEAACEEQRRLSEKFANYSGNNPNKFQADIKAARSKVRIIERRLKLTAVIPFTDEEMVEQQLDRTFPKAKSKEVVIFEGKRYRRIFSPLEFSRSGRTVTEWDKGWEPLVDGKA